MYVRGRIGGLRRQILDVGKKEKLLQGAGMGVEALLIPGLQGRGIIALLLVVGGDSSLTTWGSWRVRWAVGL